MQFEDNDNIESIKTDNDIEESNIKKRGKKKTDKYGSKTLPISNRPYFELMGYTVHKERSARLLAILAAVTTLFSMIYAMNASSELQKVPFVILKDSLGNLTPLGVATGIADPDLKADQRVVVSELSKYTKDIHTITNNQSMMVDNIKTLLLMTAPEAQQKAKNILYTQYLDSKGYEIEVVPTQFIPIPNVKNGWKINWKENKYINNSDYSKPQETSYWEAQVTFEINPQKTNDTELLMRDPLGIQIKEITIAKSIDNQPVDNDPLAQQIVGQTQKTNSDAVPAPSAQ